jgi:acyl-CoA synthetase (AMP-forming)/AMP-acid ligase II
MLLHDYVDYWVRAQPEAEFAVQPPRRMTYREACAGVNRLANAFVAHGYRPGERIALLGRNSIEYLLLYLAASKAGVVPVPLNHRLTGGEWAHIIDDADATALFVAGPYQAAIEDLRDKLTAVRTLVALDGDTTAARAGWAPLGRWSAGVPATPPDRSISEGSDVYQIYTSGTTSRPKGVVLTHRAVSANIAQFGMLNRGQPGERSIVVGALSQAGVLFTTFAPLSWGAALYICADFNPAETVRILSEERIGYANLVPAMLRAMLTVRGVAERPYDHLRLIHSGSSAIGEQTFRRVVEIFPCAFVHSYGMSEATGQLTSLLAHDCLRATTDCPRLLRSVGRAVVGTEIRIVDERNRPVPNGRMGEIIARGPQLMRGYWNLPEESAVALRGGWLHTGDAGVLDDQGYLFVVDRLKDLIVTAGENVSPRAVEDALCRHPAVAEAAVIGVPDIHRGEAVKAIVVLHPGMAATAQELIAFTRDFVAGPARPRSVDFVEALPRTTSGKVLKRIMRDPYWRDHDRRVGGA